MVLDMKEILPKIKNVVVPYMNIIMNVIITVLVKQKFKIQQIYVNILLVIIIIIMNKIIV